MLIEYIVMLFTFAVMFSFYLRFKNFFRAMCFGTISGLLFLGAYGYFLADNINFSMFTVVISAITGIPGVFMLIIFNRFFC